MIGIVGPHAGDGNIETLWGQGAGPGLHWKAQKENFWARGHWFYLMPQWQGRWIVEQGWWRWLMVKPQPESLSTHGATLHWPRGKWGTEHRVLWDHGSVIMLSLLPTESPVYWDRQWEPSHSSQYTGVNKSEEITEDGYLPDNLRVLGFLYL